MSWMVLVLRLSILTLSSMASFGNVSWLSLGAPDDPTAVFLFASVEFLHFGLECGYIIWSQIYIYHIICYIYTWYNMIYDIWYDIFMHYIYNYIYIYVYHIYIQFAYTVCIYIDMHSYALTSWPCLHCPDVITASALYVALITPLQAGQGFGPYSYC